MKMNAIVEVEGKENDMNILLIWKNNDASVAEKEQSICFYSE